MTAQRVRPSIPLSVIVGVGLLTLISCSKKEQATEPEVSVQAAKADKQPIRLIVRSEAVLFPKNQAAITPKVVAPVKAFYVNRGSRVHEGQLLAVLENRDLAAAETETKGSYHQAEAAYQRRLSPRSGKKPSMTSRPPRRPMTHSRRSTTAARSCTTKVHCHEKISTSR